MNHLHFIYIELTVHSYVCEEKEDCIHTCQYVYFIASHLYTVTLVVTVIQYYSVSPYKYGSNLNCTDSYQSSIVACMMGTQLHILQVIMPSTSH